MQEATQSVKRRRWKWLVLLALALLACAYGGLQWSLRQGRVYHALTRRLSATFGRPVEVGKFELGLLSGARIVARDVTVAEDPRFGYEYFLRAEQIAISLRWRAIFLGRVEFGSLSLERPSLNLVRNPDGQWNLESWLPPLPGPPNGTAPSTGTVHGTATTPPLYRITIDDGRINFKRGVEKHPFAFVHVDGSLEQERGGSWRLDLEAKLMRVAVAVQDSGTLRLAGRIGGAEARLRPADLRLTWEKVSLSDALRLAAGYDYGVRGALSLDFQARSAERGAAVARSPFEWKFKGSARLAGVHRWDLPPRTRDPNINLTVEASWFPEQARVEFSKLLLEGPQSSIRGSGAAGWAEPRAASLRLVSSGISVNDLLDWYRAFHADVADDARAEGSFGLDVEVASAPLPVQAAPREAWRTPLQVRSAVLATDGVELRAGALEQPLRLGRAVLRWDKAASGNKGAAIELQPATLTFDARAASAKPGAAVRPNELHIEGAIHPERNWEFEFQLGGQSEKIQDWLAAAALLGWLPAAGWQLEGGAAAKLRWEGALRPWAPVLLGTLDFRDAQLRALFLNRPALLEDVRVEWTRANERPDAPVVRSVKIQSAQVFGTKWRGWMTSPAGAPWEFSLSSDKLDVADLDRWLNPRWRDASLLQRAARQLAIGAERAQQERERALEALRASGRVSLKQFMFAPLNVGNLHGSVELDRRTLRFTADSSDFCTGKLRGTVSAELLAIPAYSVTLDVQRISIASITSGFASMKDRMTGEASGELSLSMKGSDRASLVQSLEGSGQLDLTRPFFADPKWSSAVQPTWMNYNRAGFPEAHFEFGIKNGRITLLDATLGAPPNGFPVSGTISLGGQLDLLVKEPAFTSPKGTVGAINFPGSTRRVTGTLSAPQVSLSR